MENGGDLWVAGLKITPPKVHRRDICTRYCSQKYYLFPKIASAHLRHQQHLKFTRNRGHFPSSFLTSLIGRKSFLASCLNKKLEDHFSCDRNLSLLKKPSSLTKYEVWETWTISRANIKFDSPLNIHYLYNRLFENYIISSKV